QLWKWIASLFIVCILMSSTSFSLASKRTATSLESGELDSSTGQIRLLVWQGTIDTIKQYPLFGSGPETYAYSFLPHRPAELNQTTEWNFLYNKAHNEVLHIAATLGLVGLSAWIFMYFKVGQYVWRTSSTTINNQKMSPFFVLQIALFAGIIGVFISQMLGFSVVVTNLLFWISIALVIAPSVKKSTIILSNSYRQLRLFAIVVIVIALGWTTARYLSAEISAARGSASGNFFAAHHYRQAINLNPLEPSYHQNLSFIYANMAQFGGSESQTEYIQKAEHHAQIAEQLNPLNILNLKG